MAVSQPMPRRKESGQLYLSLSAINSKPCREDRKLFLGQDETKGCPGAPPHEMI